MNEIIQTIAVYAIPVLFAITLHEAAHAYAAKYFGDSTAYLQGRMSLNPAVHIDPFGTILLPIALALLPGGLILGYAKPVPVEIGRLRNPKRDMAWVALAGPLANLFMALLWMFVLIGIRSANLQEDFFMQVALAGVKINILLFAFNLFPLPPLDGGRVLMGVLPHKLAYEFSKLEPYGFFIVLALLMMNVLHYWVGPVSTGAAWLIGLIVSPLAF